MGARPASTTPHDTVRKAEELAGVSLSEKGLDSDDAANRRSALGAPVGIAAGLTNLAEVATDPPRTGRSMIGARLTPDGHGLVIGTGHSSGEPAGAVRVRFHRPVSATGPAVVVRARWVVVAAALPRDLADALIAATAVDVRRPRGDVVYPLEQDGRR